MTYFSDWRTMDDLKAEAFNEAMESLGCPLRIKQFTPAQCTAILADNEDLLKAHGLSQRMSGDDAGEATSASRPNVDHLGRRMQGGMWRWYISKVDRLPNGGVSNGLTRMLACVASNTPFWTFVYEGAEPSDFQFFDEKLATRTDKDALLNADMNLPERDASIEAAILPRLHAELYGGSHTAVAADQLLALREKYPEEISAAIQFVRENKPPRPKLIARAHIMYVSLSTQGGETAERLLKCFALGGDGHHDDNGRAMYKLGLTVKENTRRLHDEKIYPAIVAAIEAEEAGLNFTFEETKTTVDGKKQVTGIECVTFKRRKKAATV